MKHMVYGAALLCIMVLVLAGAMIVSGKDVRANEMDRALNTAVEQTLEQLKKQNSYEIKDSRELAADFQQALLMHISSDSEVKVKILTADTEKGVLDVEVTEEYQTIRGIRKQAVCRKTVILEEYSAKKGYCLVEFQVDGNLYEKYSLYQGSTVTMPMAPKQEGRRFLGWKDSKNMEWLSEGTVAEIDTVFQAVFE